MVSLREMNVQLNMARRAPEVLAPRGRKPSLAVDIWALGALAFSLLTWQPSAYPPAGGSGGSDVASENLRIQLGPFDLAPLGAAGLLPPRAAIEARHLLAACLAVQPEKRPTAAAVRGHALFWDAEEAAQKLRALLKTEPKEAALLGALEAAGMDKGARTRLAEWRSSEAAGDLLQMCAQEDQPANNYRPGLKELLRFARNAHEHPPPGGALGLARDAGKAVRSNAVMERILAAWPELALAVFLCAPKPVTAAAAASSRSGS